MQSKAPSEPSIRLTRFRRSVSAQLLPHIKSSAAHRAHLEGQAEAVTQLLATRAPVWAAGRAGLYIARGLTTLALLSLVFGMGHSSVGGLTSFALGLGASSSLAALAALCRTSIKKYAWRRTRAFREAYEALHLAGKADASVAKKFVCQKEFGRVIALQRVLGGRDTRLGWHLRANASGSEKVTAAFSSH